MPGKACGLCLRDECERCHDANCVCCGSDAASDLGWWTQRAGEDDIEWDNDQRGPAIL